MLSIRTRGVMCAAWLAAVAAGCSQPKIEPEIASSAPHANYAASYPERVDGTVTAFADGQVKVKELSGKFSGYPGELEGDDVDYEVVATMVERADEAGRSRAYVDALREDQAVGTFYEDEKEELKKKIAGAVQYQAKQAGCEKAADIGGSAAHVLDKTMEEIREERLREANPAHALLERHRERFGEKNVEVLERQLDDVSLASYLAYIELVEHKVRLRAMIEEAERVKQTADEAIEAEKELQRESGRTDAEKEASQKRIEALQQAKSSTDASVDKAKRVEQEIEERIDKTQKQYEEARDKLIDSLRDRAKK